MKMKKALWLLGGFILAAVSAGCGKKEETAASKDYVYRSEELPVSLENDNLSTLMAAGEYVYVYGFEWDEISGGSSMNFYRLDDTGGVEHQFKIEQPPEVSYNMPIVTADGSLYAIKTVYPQSMDYGAEKPVAVLREVEEAGGIVDYINDAAVTDVTAAADESDETTADEAAGTDAAADEISDTADTSTVSDTSDAAAAASEAPAAEKQSADIDMGGIENDDGMIGFDSSESMTDQYYLTRWDEDGREIFSVNLNDISELNDQDTFYVSTLTALPGGKLLIYAAEKYALFDAEGNYLSLFELSGITEDEYGTLVTMLPLKDGRVLSYSYHENAINFREVNMDTGAAGEEYLLTGNIYSYTIFPGSGYDVFITDYNSIYGYNLGQELVQLMNFVDSDLSLNNINNLHVFDQDHFWGMIYESTSDHAQICSFTKIPPQEVKDKTSLTLAGSFIDWDVKNKVVEFNKSNEKYRIHIMDYGSLYSTAEDYNAGNDKLNVDIASGKVPDILLIHWDIPAKSYMAKGLFADLLPLIEQDEELDVNDLSPNVVKAYSMDGHLYQLVPSYYVSTVFGKTADVGSEPGWTIKEALALLASKPEGTKLFDSMTRDSMIRSSISLGGEQFVDWETGECHYDSQAFMDLLEFIKTYPEEWENSEGLAQSYWDEYQSAWREGRVVLQPGSIDSFRWLNRLEKEVFGEEITAIGFPSETGIGSVLSSNLSMALSAKSKNLEGVWEFARYFLTDEYQSGLSYGLPISMKAMERLSEASTQVELIEDENGNMVESEYYFVGDERIVLEPITVDRMEEFKQFIYSVDTTEEQNEDLINIITEEAAPFFAGQKSVNEVADIIQSRIQIYVSENR